MHIKNFWPNKALGLAIGLGLLALLLLALGWSGYRLNLTPSQPRGLYRLVPEKPGRGDYVAFCLNPEHPLADLAARRGYLGRGSCRSGRQPLLKRLLGLPGDYVTLAAEGGIVNGTFLPGTKNLELDSQGRATPSSLLAPGLIPAGLALVLSQAHPGSFDSRYFGLIPLASLQKVKSVLVLNFK